MTTSSATPDGRVHFPDLPLATGRLVLRPGCAADAAALYEMHADPVVMRYWSTPPWTSIDQAHAMLDGDAAAMRSGEALRLLIERRGDGRLVGQCTLFRLDRGCRRAEIGYGQAAWAWGQGYMDEALRALLRYGFEQLDLNRIEADIDPRNERSARSLERLGFRREGLLRERWIVAGEVSDSALFGLLRSEWAPA